MTRTEDLISKSIDIVNSRDILEELTSFSVANPFYNKTGIDAAKLKQIFLNEDPEPKIKKLKELVRNRIYNGRYQALREWRKYIAIDKAFNESTSQINSVLINYIMEKIGDNKNLKDIQSSLEKWGIPVGDYIKEIITEKTNNSITKEMYFDKNIFNRVKVSIVKPYVTIRAARIFNTRNNYPFFVYSPIKLTEESESVGKIITNIVENMVNQYGYRETLKAAIMATLKYSFCLMFPLEAWHYEEDIDETGAKYTKREGLRYIIPHPTKCAIDLTFRPSSINTDSGCSWALYWDIYKYGDIVNNPIYYNTDKVTYGTDWFTDRGFSDLYLEAYWREMHPCHMLTPYTGFAGNEIETRAQAAMYYNNSDYDKVVILTNLFMKLIPAEYGLSSYNYPIWMRFLVASDDTILFCEPVPYTPVIYFGYECDENLYQNPSFAMECMPWQTLISNLLTQHLITVRQNLWKIVPYDTDQISPEQIRKITAFGREYVEALWLPYSGKTAAVRQQDPQTMFKPIQFQYQETTSIITTINIVLNIMERCLQMSAQEVGAIAGHVQSAQEIKTIVQYMSNRVEYTASYIDSAIDAWKRQIYNAMKYFMDDEFVVEVNDISEEDAEKLRTKLGFSIDKRGSGKYIIRGSKSKISVDGFLSSRENSTRFDMTQIAQVMMNGILTILRIPQIADKISQEWITKSLNRIMQYLGAPEDFVINLSQEATTMTELKMVQQQLDELSKQISDAAAQNAMAAISQQLSPVIQKQTEELQSTQQGLVQTAQELQAVKEAVTATVNEVKQVSGGIAANMQQVADLKAAVESLALIVNDIVRRIQMQQQEPPAVLNPVVPRGTIPEPSVQSGNNVVQPNVAGIIPPEENII